MKNTFFKFYSIKEFQSENVYLGGGSFAKVKLMKHILSKKLYAVKEISLINTNESDLEIIQKEIKYHKSLNHKNIIKFEGYFREKNNVYIILEYAKNGDLFSYINKNFYLNDKVIIKLFKQTLEAIQYIHDKNIIHRDLKPENILLDSDFNIKVCDFGWCAEYFDNSKRDTFCGTYEYMAPEVLLKKYQSKKTDIWSLGILLYELIHKRAPFQGKTVMEVKDKIKRNLIIFKKNIDPESKLLILNILKVNPKERFEIHEILKSNYLNKYMTNRIPLKGKNINNINNIVHENKVVTKKIITKVYDSNSNKKIIKTTIKKYQNYESMMKNDYLPFNELLKKLEKENYKFNIN